MTEPLIWAFDIGSRSIGWAVVGATDQGDRPVPTGEVVDAGVVIHSGGILDDSKGTTRHAVRGMVVRSRRRLKRKKTRRRVLREELLKHDFALQEGWRQRNPWWARSVLASSPVQDPQRVRHLVATALPHMSKHRGWRNPWLRAPRPGEIDADRLTELETAASALTELSEESVPATIGAVSWTLLNLGKGRPSKVRQSSKDPGANQRNLNEWVPKVRQDHIAAELETIWRVQGEAHPDLFTESSLNELCETILHQVKPGVPLDRIGHCDFDSRLYRALKASPAFQRFRLLNLVTNLRIEAPDKSREPLTPSQQDLVLEVLNRGEETSWTEIGEILNLGPNRLVHADREGTAGRPPVNVIAERLNSVKGITKLRRWWEEAGDDEREALIAMALSDLTFGEEQPELLERVADQIEKEGLLELTEKFGRSLPPGRASYSRQVLNDLSDQMTGGIDLHEAITRTYGHGTAEAIVRWDDPVPNNGVELSMQEVRRLISRLEKKHGVPSVIGVEIVREATLSHADRIERSRRIQRERESREKAKEILTGDLGYDKPSASRIAKMEHIHAQAGLCLYCGTKLLVETTELDHIVPRRTGGATIFNNLAAVCPACNQVKGNRPFGRWCEDDGEPGKTRMDETLARLDNLTGPRWKPTPAKPFINPETGRWVYSELELARRDYRRRLKKTNWDPEFDDAEIHSTAFVSRIVAERLRVRYPDTRVDVFRGGFTAGLRNETKLAKRLSLGDKKDRSDRRHHAMDAIAVALLTNATWAARTRRRNEAFQNARLDLLSGEKLEEVRLTAPITDLLKTMDTVEATGAPIIERIVPILPRRLRTTGRIHEDTVRPWRPKRIGDAWTAKYISSVRDQEVAQTLWRLTSSGGSLKADPDRTIQLPDGTVLGPEDTTLCAIKMDEEKGKETPVATWLPIRYGWAKTDEIHHARLLAAKWSENGQEREAALLVPLPIVDIYEAADPIRTPLVSSMVGARAHPKLARIFAICAEATLNPTGAITQGDTLISDGELWVVTTFDPVANNAHCRPALQGGPASEGTRTAFPASKFASGEVRIISMSDRQGRSG